MDIHKLCWQYWLDLKKEINEKYKGEIDKDKAYQWIKYWSNGGGMISVGDTISDQIDNSNTYQELLDNLEGDHYFNHSTCVYFGDVINTMIIKLHEIGWGNE